MPVSDARPMSTFVMLLPVMSGVYVPSSTFRCSTVPDGSVLPKSSVMVPFVPY